MEDSGTVHSECLPLINLNIDKNSLLAALDVVVVVVFVDGGGHDSCSTSILSGHTFKQAIW